MIKKRGLSNSIKITILILLILITAIIIILVIRKTIDTPADELTLKLKTEDVHVINENTLGVKVAVDSGEGKISSVNFIINNGEVYEIITMDATLNELENEFILDLQDVELNEYTKISVSPILKLNSGETITGKSGEIYTISQEYLEYIAGKCTDSCSSLKYECGTHTICGTNQNCGTCGTNFTCQINGTCIKDNVCAPATCTTLAIDCGNVSDGCNNILNCGNCSVGICQTNGTCTATPCTDTCNSLNHNCGSVCGATCGNYSGGCQAGYGCQTNGTCIKDACIVISYTPALNTFCGTRSVVDNCGNTLSKTGTVSCNSPNTCVNNVCQGCTATSYTPALNTFCGTRSVVDNCGNTLSKTGTVSCNSPNTCVNNVCQGCTATSYTPALNTFCGTRSVVDNCGNTLSKTGTLPCNSPNTCVNNACITLSWQTGMIAWWKLDLNSLDSIGTHSGANYGATFQTTGCVSGQCASFDGTSNYIQIAYASDLNPDTDLTMAAWISWDGTGGEQNVLTKEGCYEFRVDWGDVNYATNPWEWRGGTSAPISSNAWTHVVVTHDGNGQQIIYINGVNKYSTASGGDIFNNEEPLTIGGRLSASAFFDGKIDEVMVWNRALSSTEIQSLFNSYDYTNPDCTATSYTPALNTFCGSRTVVDNCGVSSTKTGTVPCNSPNTCVNNACNGCVVTSYTPALNTFCGTRSVVDNCGNTLSKTGTVSCNLPQTCGGGGTANVCGCTATSYTPALNTFCGSRTVVDNCGISSTKTGTLPCNSPNTCVNNACTTPSTGAIIINHLNTDITQIPTSCITKAKALTFQYAHRSDGGNILEGLNYVYNKNNAFKSAYQINSLPSQTNPIQLRIMDGNPPQPDYSYPENYWNSADGRTATADNWASGNFDASMWSWCSEFNQGYLASDLANSYLNIMNGMEADYPNIKFIYMTSYGDYNDPNIAASNQIIRNYAINNDKILYDFEDIGRCDPDGNCYSSATRDCSWCSTWCASHSSYCTNLPSTCAHTHGLLCAQRASAFWWMMARLAGWDGNPSSSC